MKRFILFGLFLTTTLISSAGESTSVQGPVTILGNVINVGDTLCLGQGTTSLGQTFTYILKSGFGLIHATNLVTSECSVILDITCKEKKTKKYYATIKIGLLNTKYNVELEPAIRFGEVVSLNGVDFNKSTQKPISATNNSLSSADELKKFKELLDKGVITQEEFDAKKKKILEEN